MTWSKGRWAAFVAAVSLAGLAGCMPSPAKPGEGELTGVVVRGDGTWPDGGLSTAPAQTVVLMSPADYQLLYAQANPGEEVPTSTADMASTPWQMSGDAVERDVSAGRWPLLVEVVDSRFRVPWDGRDAVLCLAGGPEGVLPISGCEPLQGQPPQEVVVYTGQTFGLSPA